MKTIDNYIEEQNSYLVAIEILKDSKHKYFKQANDFLKEYARLENIIGDNDNPFNPNVYLQIELEETFLKTVVRK